MSNFKQESRDFSKDLFGGVYQKNTDIFKTSSPSQSRFSQLKVRSSDVSDKSIEDIGNTSSTYSPNRRTPHKQSFDFDSPNPSLSAINQKALSQQQQDSQPLWFNNPKRRTIPSQVIKRGQDADNDASTFLTKAKSSSDSATGFNTLTFGTKRHNIEHSNLNTFSDELPPTRTISDLQKDEYNDSFLSLNNDVGNNSVISQRLNGDQSLLGSQNGTPIFKNKQGALPDHFLKSQSNSAFSTPSKRAFNTPQGKGFLFQSEQEGIDQNEAQLTLNQSNQQSDKEESAVLVFGYPESIANSVIKHFAKFGNILEDFESTRVDPLFSKNNTKSYPIFTGDGWVKLTYDSRASALRALEESGGVFHGSIIGCVPYSKQAIENVASINIDKKFDIGQTDNHFDNSQNVQEDSNFPASFSKRITLKNDDKIFVKSKDQNKALYSSSNTHPTQPNGNTFVGRVNNWLFGWEDL